MPLWKAYHRVFCSACSAPLHPRRSHSHQPQLLILFTALPIPLNLLLSGQASSIHIIELCLQVAEAAYEMLSMMDEEAAAANNKIDLFISERRFPEVFEARQEVADADEGLVRGPLSSCHFFFVIIVLPLDLLLLCHNSAALDFSLHASIRPLQRLSQSERNPCTVVRRPSCCRSCARRWACRGWTT